MALMNFETGFGITRIAGSETNREGATGAPKTAEEVRAGLESVMQDFFRRVEKAMEGGLDFEAALQAVCRENPDLIQHENQLRDWLKALGSAEQSVAGS